MEVTVPWFVIPAPPPKTAKEAAAPRLGASAAVLAKPRLDIIGTVQAATKANIRSPNPPRTFVKVFISYTS
jgi:hypothetical protein